MSTPMKPRILALASPTSPHSIVLAPGLRASPFWGLSSAPPPGSLLWAMQLARETNFDPEAVPSFMAHFGGEVDGSAFAVLDDEGAWFCGIPPEEAHRFIGFVLEPVTETLSASDIARRTGIPYSSLHNWTMRKGFPDRLEGPGAAKWSWFEIENWLRSPAADKFAAVQAWRAENPR